MNGPFKPVYGGHDAAQRSYRVEIVVLCPRRHKLLPFSRSTLPRNEHEGVIYESNKLGRFARLRGVDYQGREWQRINLFCETPLPTGGRCKSHVQVNRDRLEQRLAKMWAPNVRRVERVIWDEQSD